MRILVLTKRQYTNRDLIDDRFGRLRELPLALSSLGHKVEGVCLSYRGRDEGKINDVEKNARVTWHTLNAMRLMPLGLKNYWSAVAKIGRELRPNIVWACSDAFHAILGIHVAKSVGASLIIDLYDNFESFTATRLLGVKFMFRKALRSARGITCVSKPLARYVFETSSFQGPVAIIENAVPEGRFYPMNQVACRREFGLPKDGVFIGSAGAIAKSRGIETLFRAFDILARERTDIHLVLAGACDKGLTFPKNPRTHYLGMLPPESVPAFLSMLNVAVVCNRESAFGKYCFPQKFHEAVACNVPVVAAGTGTMKELLKKNPQCLYKPDNADDLADALRRQLNNPILLSIKIPTWDELGGKLSNFFKELMDGHILKPDIFQRPNLPVKNLHR
jgi:teichuronic acid biosynthesis glycosyltransferase TuaC